MHPKFVLRESKVLASLAPSISCKMSYSCSYFVFVNDVGKGWELILYKFIFSRFCMKRKETHFEQEVMYPKIYSIKTRLTHKRSCKLDRKHEEIAPTLIINSLKKND